MNSAKHSYSLLAVCLLIATCCLLLPARLLRADNLPPAPSLYFTDYASVVDPASADSFNTQLANFERQTSNQILVVVYPKLTTGDDLSDYCNKVFRKWGVGQKNLNNGAILFVFVQDHKMYIETGYGLEGSLPDATCDSILNDQMRPLFRQGDFTAGIRVGINSIIAATRGEYKGAGHTVRDKGNSRSGGAFFWIIFAIIIGFNLFRRITGTMYGSVGRGVYTGMFLGGGGGGGGGGWGGGFSGGGGSSGGGGAGGSW